MKRHVMSNGVQHSGRSVEDRSKRMSADFAPVPAWIRFYLYGMHGFLDEIVFTSIFAFVESGFTDWSLKGHSSLSSFFIYGSCSFVTEQLYVFLYYKHGVPRLARIILYLGIAYSWEFIFGLILRQFDACPWDYSHYKYNFMGLITLEYAPGWLVLCFLQDTLADYLLNLYRKTNCKEKNT